MDTNWIKNTCGTLLGRTLFDSMFRFVLHLREALFCTKLSLPNEVYARVEDIEEAVKPMFEDVFNGGKFVSYSFVAGAWEAFRPSAGWLVSMGDTSTHPDVYDLIEELVSAHRRGMFIERVAFWWDGFEWVLDINPKYQDDYDTAVTLGYEFDVEKIFSFRDGDWAVLDDGCVPKKGALFVRKDDEEMEHVYRVAGVTGKGIVTLKSLQGGAEIFMWVSIFKVRFVPLKRADA